MSRTFKPSPEQRRQVKSLAGFGLSLEQIAVLISRSPKKVKRHFAKELKRGRAEATAQVAQTVLKLAVGGNITACIFLLDNCSHWGSNAPPNVAPQDEKLEIVLHEYAPPRRTSDAPDDGGTDPSI
jgi:hypothetical protein